MTQHEDHDLGSIMRRLEESNRALMKVNLKLSSAKWSFMRGVLYGFGFFIGSAILATALIFVLSRIEGWAYIGRYAHNILEILRSASR